MGRFSVEPITPVAVNLTRLELAVESTRKLRITMTIQAKDREIAKVVIRGIGIDVVYLDRLPTRAANAARAIRQKQRLGGDSLWDGGPVSQAIGFPGSSTPCISVDASDRRATCTASALRARPCVEHRSEATICLEHLKMMSRHSSGVTAQDFNWTSGEHPLGCDEVTTGIVVGSWIGEGP